MYSNNILNFQESTTILNVCAKKSGNLLKAPRNTKNETKYFEQLLIIIVIQRVVQTNIPIMVFISVLWSKQVASKLFQRDIPLQKIHKNQGAPPHTFCNIYLMFKKSTPLHVEES